METKLKRVHTASDLAISAAVLCAGAGLYFLNNYLGIFLGVCAVAMFIFWKSAFKADGHGPVLKKKTVDIAQPHRLSVLEFLSGKDVEPVLDAPAAGNSSLLEVYYNKQNMVAYAQLFDFSNYTYEKATELVELHSARAEKLISKLK